MQIKHHHLYMSSPSQSVRQIQHRCHDFTKKTNLDDADDDEGDGRQALQGRGNNEVQTEGVPKDAGILMMSWISMEISWDPEVFWEVEPGDHHHPSI